VDHNESLHWLDAGSVGVAVATFFGWMPNIAALLSVVWLLLRIYQTYSEIKQGKAGDKDDD
jgi:hypothetical protein